MNWYKKLAQRMDQQSMLELIDAPQGKPCGFHSV
jgi:hypothetical protein